jgi:pimeloyl-ACP methyl ester carboxylesterase
MSTPSPSHPPEARHESAPTTRLVFHDDLQFWYEARRAFGSSSYGASEFGEVLAAVSRIKSGDFDSWYNEFNAMAERVEAEAKTQLAGKHRVSARDSFLRATTYYRTSEFFLHGNQNDPRIYSAYRKSIECYKQCCALCDLPVLPVEIPYEKTTLPGYFHRVDNSGRKRPLFIIHSGFDGSAEELHAEGALAGLERGYNVLTFDGPGQYGPIHRERLPFRPDWEKVVTPVVDYALTLPEVDPAKIALMGISMGGVLAPRAAAFEKRISALVANDGLYDFGAAILKEVPAAERPAVEAALNAKEAPQLDRALEQQAKSSTTAAWEFAQGMFVFGAATPRAAMAEMLKYHLRDGVAEKISCPTLVLDAESDMFFKGQPEALYDHLTCPKTMIRFTDAEGAGSHCQVGAHRMAFARIYDWLDDTFKLSS